jgi:hypothetical protein
LTGPPFLPGQFVWCRFPYSEAPLPPGDKERVVYVADVRQHAGRQMFTVMPLCRTTVQWERGTPLPLGVIPVAIGAAAKMKQKPFVIDARRIAFVPANESYFPRLRAPDGAVIHEATKAFRAHIENVLARLANRPDLVQLLGPDIPSRR